MGPGGTETAVNRKMTHLPECGDHHGDASTNTSHCKHPVPSVLYSIRDRTISCSFNLKNQMVFGHMLQHECAHARHARLNQPIRNYKYFMFPLI